MSPASHLFVVPARDSAPSGGNRYNDGLLEQLMADPALRVVRSDLAGLEAALQQPLSSVWLDSLYLERAPAVRGRLAANVRLLLIAHSLPSLLEQAALALPIARPESCRRERSWLEPFDAALAPSDTMAAWLNERRPGLPVWVVEPAIYSAPLAPRSGPLRALLVANLVANKGVLPFLQSLCAQLRPSDVLSLRCIGSREADPGYAAACQALLREPLPGACVQLLGARTYEQVLAELARCDVLVSASRLESFGMAIADARAAGCIVLARAGGHVARLLTAPGHQLLDDDDALAHALLTLAREPATLALRRQQAEQARLPARSWAELAAQVRPLLQAQAARNDQ